MKPAFRLIAGFASLNLCVLAAHAQFTSAVTITGYTGPGGAVEIPTNINGLTVTAIGEGAFRSNSSITSINIPVTVTNIGSGAFQFCKGLTNVIVTRGLLEIGDGAFAYCSKLRSVAISDSVTRIGSSAFVGCSSLESVAIPQSVTRIGSGAFSGCFSLTAFIVDPVNPVFSSLEGILFDKTRMILIQYPPGKVGACAVPMGTTIADNAFSYCTNLTSIIVGETVTSIGYGAFRDCASLTNITLGKGVTSIEPSAFENTGLTAFFVDNLNPVFSGADGILFNKDQTTLLQYPAAKSGAYLVPNTVNLIAPRSFYQCTKVTEVSISNGATSIGNSAFGSCTNLTTVTLQNGIASIGDWAFSDCTSLWSVAILNGLTNIGDYAFAGCISLNSVAIPNGVTRLGQAAFNNCRSLTNITIPDTITRIADYTFAGCDSLRNIIVPRGVISLENGSFEFCAGLSSVSIADSVTSIGNAAFAWCTSLTNLSIPNSVTNIGESAFQACNSLTSIEVDVLNTFYSSRDGVLFDKDQLTLILYPAAKADYSYSVPDSVSSLLDRAFEGSTVTIVTIPGSVTNIGTAAFAYCSSLSAIVVDPLNSFYSSDTGVLFNKDKTVLLIYPQAGLTSYVIPSGVTKIGDYAFYYCYRLTGITIPTGVNIIGDYAFSGCFSLTNIMLPEDVSTIGAGAFSSCVSLVNLVLGDGISTIGDLAFSGCSALTNVIIPHTVTSLGEWPFASCTSLQGVYFEGNAPSVRPGFVSGPILPIFDDPKPTVYYLPGSAGWSATFAGCPTALWLPRIRIGDAPADPQTSQYGFTILWASGMTVVVEACTNLAAPTWSPMLTNTLPSSSLDFIDSNSPQHPHRFYRVRAE